MGQVIYAAIAYIVLQLIVPFLWERFMSTAPDWTKGWVLFAATLVCAAFVVCASPVYSRVTRPSEHPVSSTLIVAGLLATIGGAAWWWIVVPAGTSAGPLTLQTLFQQEFDNALKIARDATLTLPSGQQVQLRAQGYYDSRGIGKHVGYFVPAGVPTFEVCRHLVTAPLQTLADIEQGPFAVVQSQVGSNQRRTWNDFQFTQLVVIYHEDALTAREVADLEDLYRANGFTLELYGPDHLAFQMLGRLKTKP